MEMTLPEKSGPKPGISAILIVYNEEKIIERCLQSLAGAVDEIIILHDGECKDNTLAIAKKYTDKVYVEAHTGESELHKIHALEYAVYSWILRIDADEYLSEELRCSLQKLIHDERVDVYAFLWPIWNGSTYITRDVPYKDILFRKDKICAVEFPHKTYSTTGVRQQLPLLLEHRPKYNNFTWSTFKRKWVRWIKDQAEWTYHHQNIHFYNTSAEQVDAYHKSMERQILYAHPLLAPAWFGLSFFKFFFRLKSWNNAQLIKISVLQGLYAVWLCYYLWQEKRNLGKL